MLRLNLDYLHIVQLYRSGLSENQIAKHLGVSRTAIRKRLIKAGITPRTQSEAESLKWSQFTPEQRRQQVAAANKACRGRVHSEEERIKRAQTTYVRQLRISANEQRLADMLRAQGLTVEQQFPVYTCNVDLAVHPGPIAVEVHGGGWHSAEGHRLKLLRKREQLFSRGWALIEVWVDGRYKVWDAMANELVTLCHQLGRLPAVSGEHWVVFGNRKVPSFARADGDDIAAVYRTHRSRNRSGLDPSAT